VVVVPVRRLSLQPLVQMVVEEKVAMQVVRLAVALRQKDQAAEVVVVVLESVALAAAQPLVPQQGREVAVVEEVMAVRARLGVQARQAVLVMYLFSPFNTTNKKIVHSTVLRFYYQYEEEDIGAHVAQTTQ
jgi:hypothetical protein